MRKIGERAVDLFFSRTKLLKITDERVKIMSEIIKSMRIVKMYCWEAAFDEKIKAIRKYIDLLFIGSLIVFSSSSFQTRNYPNWFIDDVYEWSNSTHAQLYQYHASLDVWSDVVV